MPSELVLLIILAVLLPLPLYDRLPSRVEWVRAVLRGYW